MGLHRSLQVKEGRIQKPVTRRWAVCTGPRGERRSTGRRTVPNRGPDLIGSSDKTWRSLPSCWNSYSTCAADRAALTAKESQRDGQPPPGTL